MCRWQARSHAAKLSPGDGSIWLGWMVGATLQSANAFNALLVHRLPKQLKINQERIYLAQKQIHIYNICVHIIIAIILWKVLVCKTSSLLTPSGSPPLGSRSIRSTDVVYLDLWKTSTEAIGVSNGLLSHFGPWNKSFNLAVFFLLDMESSKVFKG